MEILKTYDTENQENPIKQRGYLKISGRLESPLLIGSGEDTVTDMDVLLDSSGKPFIPGTSLAGMLKQGAALLDQNAAERLFGKSQIDNPQGRQSQAFIYDAKLDDAKISTRDGVRLDEYKTAVGQAKYELQMVESKAKFTIFVEIVQRIHDTDIDDDLKILYDAFSALNRGTIRLGAKKHRGFGKVALEPIRVKVFHMDCHEERNAWLDWEMRSKDAFEDAESVDLQEIKVVEHCLRVPLKVKQTLMIRRYADLLSETADYRQLTEGNMAVIPGSTWMGAIRARIAKIMRHICNTVNYEECQNQLSEFFGSSAKTSQVKVDESIVSGASFVPMTRTAIDRFTGGVVQGALYTEEVAAHGETELILRWPMSVKEKEHEEICGLLLWAIQDLRAGLLAVGGETAVGRGVFQGEKNPIFLDEEALTDYNKYSQAAVDWCKGGAATHERRCGDKKTMHFCKVREI